MAYRDMKVRVMIFLLSNATKPFAELQSLQCSRVDAQYRKTDQQWYPHLDKVFCPPMPSHV